MAKQGPFYTMLLVNERRAQRMIAGFYRDNAYHAICCEAKKSGSVSETDRSREDIV